MKTSCGATLVATQFTDTVEWSTGAAGVESSKTAKAAQALGSAPAASTTAKGFPENSPDEQVQVVDAKTREPIPEIAYYIEAPDGSIYAGHTDENGLCERVATYQPEELSVWFGEEAEKKMQAA